MSGDGWYRDSVGFWHYDPTLIVDAAPIGDGGTFTPPTLSMFGTTIDSLDSSNALVATDREDGFRLSKVNAAAGNTNRWGMVLKALPAAPKTFEFVIKRLFPYANWHGAGLVLRESATGKLKNFGWTNDGGGFCVNYWTGSGDTFGDANVLTQDRPEVVRCRLVFAASGTPRLSFERSLDGGENWVRYYGAALTDNFTTAPDQIGFGVNANSASFGPVATTLDVLHYAET
jgi:hypothetical protein